MTDARRARRLEILAAHGATPAVVDEVLAYTEKPFTPGVPPSFPLADEAHLEAWRSYAAESREVGAFEALRRRFAQLRFPIRPGISQEWAYGEAVRRGHFEAADTFAPGLTLSAPDRIELEIRDTIAGHIPVVVARERADFEALVRAFTERNEPVPVPSSMGACIVTGLNNWDRVRTYREQWEASHAPDEDGGWAAEFKRMATRKELYQDRMIILSAGPYSNVTAAEIGLSDAQWLRQSIAIRCEHECTHYYTYRVFGSMRNHVFDELIADFVGLLRGAGTYRSAWALRFLGLDTYPVVRHDGRLALYCGTLSQDGVAVVSSLAVAASRQLEALHPRAAVADIPTLAMLTYSLTAMTLEELAGDDMPALALEALR